MSPRMPIAAARHLAPPGAAATAPEGFGGRPGPTTATEVETAPPGRTIRTPQARWGVFDAPAAQAPEGAAPLPSLPSGAAVVLGRDDYDAEVPEERVGAPIAALGAS